MSKMSELAIDGQNEKGDNMEKKLITQVAPFNNVAHMNAWLKENNAIKSTELRNKIAQDCIYIIDIKMSKSVENGNIYLEYLVIYEIYI